MVPHWVGFSFHWWLDYSIVSFKLWHASGRTLFNWFFWWCFCVSSPGLYCGYCGANVIYGNIFIAFSVFLFRYRGALGSTMQLMVNLGILFNNVNCNTNWRVSSGFRIRRVLGLPFRLALACASSFLHLWQLGCSSCLDLQSFSSQREIWRKQGSLFSS